MTSLFGILNLSSDSFSDGGEFSKFSKAVEQGNLLLKQGANVLDLGAQSSNPEANLKSPEQEWTELSPVLQHFVRQGDSVSIDSFQPKVQGLAAKAGAHFLNDISGFTHPDSKLMLADLNDSKIPNLVVMHSHTGGIARVSGSPLNISNVVSKIIEFLRDRKKQLNEWNIPDSKLIFDPGMGFFLGKDPEISFEVLRKIDVFLNEFPNLLISVSRKSFLTLISGNVPPKEREIATLLVESYLIQKRVPWIRTHNPAKIMQSKNCSSLLSSSSDSFS